VLRYLDYANSKRVRAKIERKKTDGAGKRNGEGERGKGEGERDERRLDFESAINNEARSPAGRLSAFFARNTYHFEQIPKNGWMVIAAKLRGRRNGRKGETEGGHRRGYAEAGRESSRRRGRVPLRPPLSF